MAASRFKTNQTYELDFLDDIGGWGWSRIVDMAFDPIGIQARKWGPGWFQFRIEFGWRRLGFV